MKIIDPAITPRAIAFPETTGIPSLTREELASQTRTALGHFSYITSCGYNMTALMDPDEGPLYVPCQNVLSINGVQL